VNFDNFFPFTWNLSRWTLLIFWRALASNPV